MRYRFATIVFAVLAACAIPGPAAVPGALEPLDAEALQDTLTELIATHPTAKRTNVALKVTDLETGEVLFDQNSDKLYTPASNLKIYTSAAALDFLGPDYRWTTSAALVTDWGEELSHSPIIELIPGGDPMLDTAQLLELANTLKAKVPDNAEYFGINLVASDRWDQVPLKGPGWMWDDDPDYYNMSIGPIALNFNTMQITVSSLPKEVTVGPDLWRALGILVEYTPSSSYPPKSVDSLSALSSPEVKAVDRVEITRDDFQHEILIRGLLKPDAKPTEARITMHNPNWYAVSVFKLMLANAGLSVIGQSADHYDGDGAGWGVSNGAVVRFGEPQGEILAEHQGKTNAEAVKHFLKVSENAVGEMLLLTLSEKFGEGEKVSWPSGAKVISDWLINEAGLEEGSFRLVDGSGLSRYNLISADSSIRLLAYMKNESEHFEPFFDGLPIYKVALPKDAGAKWGGVPIAEFDTERVFAKPGGMSGVSTISGYVKTLDGHWLAFSLLGNGYIGSSAPVRDLRNQVWAELVRYQSAEAVVPSE